MQPKITAVSAIRRPVSSRFPNSTATENQSRELQDEVLEAIRTAQHFLRSPYALAESPLYKLMIARLGTHNEAVTSTRDAAMFFSSNLASYPYGAGRKMELKLHDENKDNSEIPSEMKSAIKGHLEEAGKHFFRYLNSSVIERQVEDNFLQSEIKPTKENIRRLQASLCRVIETIEAANKELWEALKVIDSLWTRETEDSTFKAIQNFEKSVDTLHSAADRIKGYAEYYERNLNELTARM